MWPPAQGYTADKVAAVLFAPRSSYSTSSVLPSAALPILCPLDCDAAFPSVSWRTSGTQVVSLIHQGLIAHLLSAELAQEIQQEMKPSPSELLTISNGPFQWSSWDLTF